MSLRAALQKVESDGMVEFTLGGHSCSRPPLVQQGRASDHFVIQADGGNSLLWRPNQIPSKNLKAANIASHFNYDLLEKSPLRLVSGTIYRFMLIPIAIVFHYVIFCGNMNHKQFFPEHPLSSIRYGAFDAIQPRSVWQQQSRSGTCQEIWSW